MESLKTKVVAKYNELFNEETDPVDFAWEEFFLLRPNTEELSRLLLQADKAQLTEGFLREALRSLTERAVECVANESSVSVYNAAQTFLIVLESMCTHFSLQFTFENYLCDAERDIATILRRFYFFLVEPLPEDLKVLSLHFTERLCLLAPDANTDDVDLLSRFVFVHSLDVVTAIFAQLEATAYLSHQAVCLLSTVLGRARVLDEKSDPFLTKFSGLHDDIALQGLSHLILEQLSSSNEFFAEFFANQKAEGGVFSKISNFLSFGGDDESSEGDTGVDLPFLLVFLEAVRLNKSFVSNLLTVRSSVDSENDERGGGSMLLRHFFTFCSFAFEDTKTSIGLYRTRLCLLITLLLSDDVFIQNSLHDPHNISVVPLFRSEKLHRTALLDMKRPACTLGTTALDLMAELFLAHLKIGFPLEFYDLSLGIIHRILAYQKNRCIRMTQWLSLFNAILALMRFLLAHESKCTTIYPLLFRLMVIINLFLTFGDTFLPSGEAYDYLYYEMVRQEAVLNHLEEVVERRLEGEKNSDWEYAAKVKSHLINPLIIINTIKSKLQELEGKEDLTQEAIVGLIRGSFETLSLKLYDGLTIVAPYDNRKQQEFFVSLGRALYEEALGRCDQQPPVDYRQLVDNLSSMWR